MATGEWSGTMNLTEPQCGTDLGMVRTKAVPNGGSKYGYIAIARWLVGSAVTWSGNQI